jgi:hypothetical protein
MINTRSLKALSAALLVVLLGALPVLSNALAADGPSCRETAGAARATTLVEQCLLVSAGTDPPCNADKPCAQIIDEIKRSCTAIRQSMRDRPAQPPEEGGEPAFCKAHLGN